MSCNHHVSAANVQTPCNKCNDASREKASDKCQPLFREAIGRFADRHQELDDRERLLHDKIAIMERSIPALMAMSMWQASEGQSDSAAALDKVRNLMKKLSPLPDPADELVAQLAGQVEELDRETTELHGKIINADVELEENCMELESLELANRELEEQIKCMETKMGASLESISSDDRICLAKIRKLGEEEIRIKKSIEELEEREAVLRNQIERILGTKGTGDKKVCDVLQGQKHHVHRPRSRRKKDCQKLGSTVESLFECDKICGVTHCDALNQIVEQKSPVTCKCQKKSKPSHRKTTSCDRSVHKCSPKTHSEKSCEHKDLEPKSYKRFPESADKSCHTKQRSCSSSPTKAAPDDSPQGLAIQVKPTTPCAVILIKACECKGQPGKFCGEIKPLDQVVRTLCQENNHNDALNKALEYPFCAEASENPCCTMRADCSCLTIPRHVESIEIRTQQYMVYDETHMVTKQKSKVD